MEPRKKLDALLQIGARIGGQPEVSYLLGFLAGRLDRVHFVRSLEGAPVGVRLAAGRRRLWPGSPFEASVRGVPVPGPALFVAALCDADDDICVQLELDDLAAAPWYQELTVASYADLRGSGGQPAENLRERIEQVRQHIDNALDVYRECRRLLGEGAGDREAQVRFFLRMAQDDIEGLGRRLQALREELAPNQTQP